MTDFLPDEQLRRRMAEDWLMFQQVWREETAQWDQDGEDQEEQEDGEDQ